MLCFTNNIAVDNIRSHLLEKLKGVAHTFNSYFNEYGNNQDNILGGKDVFIDEYSMVPNRWMTLINNCYTRKKLRVNLYGDNNQCDPVEGTSQL